MIDFIRYVLNYSADRRERVRKSEWKLLAVCLDDWTYTDTKRTVVFTVSLFMNGYGDKRSEVYVHGGEQHDKTVVHRQKAAIAAKHWEKGGPMPTGFQIDIDVGKQLIEALVDKEMGI